MPLLRRAMGENRDGYPRLLAAVASTFAGSALTIRPGSAHGSQRLADTRRQILPDGGTCRTVVLIEILLDLLPLEQLRARKCAPPALQNASDLMTMPPSSSRRRRLVQFTAWAQRGPTCSPRCRYTMRAWPYEREYRLSALTRNEPRHRRTGRPPFLVATGPAGGLSSNSPRRHRGLVNAAWRSIIRAWRRPRGEPANTPFSRQSSCRLPERAFARRAARDYPDMRDQLVRTSRCRPFRPTTTTLRGALRYQTSVLAAANDGAIARDILRANARKSPQGSDLTRPLSSASGCEGEPPRPWKESASAAARTRKWYHKLGAAMGPRESVSSAIEAPGTSQIVITAARTGFRGTYGSSSCGPYRATADTENAVCRAPFGA